MPLKTEITEYYLLCLKKQFEIVFFKVAHYGLYSLPQIKLTLLCPITRTPPFSVGDHAELRVRAGQDFNYFSGAIQKIVVREGGSHHQDKRYELLLSSIFFSTLQISINNIYPSQTISEFIRYFINQFFLNQVRFSIHIEKKHIARPRVVKHQYAYDFFKDMLLEEGIYFIAKKDNDGELLYFTDDLKMYSSPKTIQTVRFDRRYEKSRLIDGSKIKESVYGLTHELSYSPGDSVRFEDKTYHIETIEISGQHAEKVYGSTQRARRLSVWLCLMPINGVCSVSKTHKRPPSYQIGTIVSCQERTIDIDYKGQYQIQYDFLSKESPSDVLHDVKKCVTFSGENSGGDMPLEANTKVMLSIPYGQLDKPIILGAIGMMDNSNKLSYSDIKKNVIKSAGGGCLIFHDVTEAPGISVSMKNDASSFYLSKKMIKLNASLGKLSFISGGYAQFTAGEAILLKTTNNSQQVSQKNITILTKQMLCDVKQSMYLYATDVFMIKSQSMHYHANQTMKYQIENSMVLQGKTLELQTKKGTINVLSPSLTLKADRMCFSCGASSLLIEDGLIKLTAPIIEVDGIMTGIAT